MHSNNKPGFTYAAACGLVLASACMAAAQQPVPVMPATRPASMPVISLNQQGVPAPQMPQMGDDGFPVLPPGTSAQQPARQPAFPPAPGGTGVKGATLKRPVEQRTPVAPSGRSLMSMDQDGSDLAKEGSPAHKMQVGDVLDPPTTVLPEATTTVSLSSSDLNRIICTSGDVKEALTSDEKGLMIKITGRDVFVKYKVGKRSDGKLSYSTTPTELYIVCGENTYSMIAFPDRRPSQTIRLSSGIENRAKENQSLYEGLPFEKRVMRLIKEVYTDAIPESYTLTKRDIVDASWKGMVITLKREVSVDGEGMHLKEYHIHLKPGVGQMKLSEKLFLKKEFAINPIAVSIDKHNLKQGEVSRLFIVEQRADQPLGGNGFGQFMSVDGMGADPAPAASPSPQSTMPQRPTMPAGGRPVGSTTPRGAIPTGGR